MRNAQKVLLALLALMVIGIAALVAFTMVTDRRLATAIARLPQPMPTAQATRRSLTESDAGSAQSRVEADEAMPSSEATAADWGELCDEVSAWLAGTGNRVLEFAGHKMADEPVPPRAPDDLLKRIRTMVERGGPVFSMDSSDVEGYAANWAVLHERLMAVTNCAVLLAEDGRLALEEGDSADALQSLLATMKLADLLIEGPTRYFRGQGQRVYDRLEPYLEGRPLPSDLAARLLEQLALADARESMDQVLADDARLSVVRWEAFKTGTYADRVESGGVYWGTRSWLWAHPISRPWYNQKQVFCIGLFLRLREVSDLAYHEAEPTLDEVRASIDDYFIEDMVSRQVIRSNLGPFADQARHEAKLDVMQMGILIDQYYAREGQYPQTLDAIVEGFGGALPVDPFTGNPYHYELYDSRYVIHNAGTDGYGGTLVEWLGRIADQAAE